MRASLTRLAVIAGLTLSASLAQAPGAHAHATLLRCNVAAGARLPTVPRTLICTFAEGVNPKGSFIGVFETTGDHAEVDKENSQVSFSNAKEMTLSLPMLHKGTYVLLWYTISADDGHRAGGYFTFSIT